MNGGVSFTSKGISWDRKCNITVYLQNIAAYAEGERGAGGGGPSEKPGPTGEVLPENRRKLPFMVRRWLMGGPRRSHAWPPRNCTRACTIKLRKPTQLSSAAGCTSGLRVGIGWDKVNHDPPLISCHEFGGEGIEFTVAECLSVGAPGSHALSGWS